ncbi:MAG: DnaB-like helicase C-terminal domain-containing protein [Candidatus Vecturithrix sp.]|nr:DnaB-like helicase C-terminal domain-containing protein [Candidatus Vecturithrix sp.]
MASFQDFNIEIPPGHKGEIRTTCPKCSGDRRKTKDKCLSVNSDEGVWHCFHCGYSGSLKEGGGTQYKRPEYERPSIVQKKVLEWFVKRGISEKTLLNNGIGYGRSFTDKNGIQFPYYKDGQVVNIKHRTADKQFRQEKDAEKCLYRHDAIKAGKGGTLIICEGEIDALSFVEAGFEYAASIPDGAPSENSKTFHKKFEFLKSAEKIIDQYERVIVATDNDGPGVRAKTELARRIGVERCLQVTYPAGCKDANDVIVKFGKDALIDVVKSAKPFPIDGVISPEDLQSQLCNIYQNGYSQGSKTGWSELDELYTVCPGQMTIVTGIPGSGKSNVVDNLILNLALSEGWRFAVFSPENWPPEIHAHTMIEKLVRKPFLNTYSKDRMSIETAMAALRELNDMVHFIMPNNESLNVDTILDKTKKLIFQYGVKGLVIDPWNEVEHNFGALREDQYISQELTKIRRFSRLNGIHIWVVAHPKNLRKADDGTYKPPTMYEISGGAHWRNKADNGICVHRPDFTDDITEVYIQKIRFKWVGRLGKVNLRYIRNCGIYLDNKDSGI